MRRRTSLTAVALTGLLLTVGAAGCGLTDNGPKPGVAAEVDGETLTLATVDDAVEDYCTLLAEHPDEQAFPTALIRTQVTLLWSRSIAIDAVASEYDVPQPAALDRGAVEAQWAALGEIDDDNVDSFTWLSEIQTRDDAMVEAIGTAAFLADGGQPVVGEDAYAKGNELVAAWLTDHEPDLNPVFGSVDWETGTISADGLSVPVSDAAFGMLDISNVAPDVVAELPESQRCGPAPKADAVKTVPAG